VFSNKEREDGV
jgi:hypothetical protein